MDDSEEFMSRWKPIHEKTIVKYVLLESIIYFLCTALVTVFFLWIYPSISINNKALDEYGIYFVIGLNAMTFIFFIVFRLTSWYKGEKQYRKILNQL